MGILKNYDINVYATEDDGYESWAWARLSSDQRLMYGLEMANNQIDRMEDPDYEAAQRRASDRRGWEYALHHARGVRDYLASRITRLMSLSSANPKAAPARRAGRSARRAGRSARAPASGGDDDGDGDDEDLDRPRRFYISSFPGAPTRDELAPWEALLKAEGFTSEAPHYTYRPDYTVADASADADDADADADDGPEPWRDPTNPFRTRSNSVTDDLIAEEDQSAITPAVQARLDRAAKAKAKADADRLKRQRLAVLAACANARQRMVFEILCGGATAEEAAAAAGYASATVVTKMVSRWVDRAGKGRIAVGFEQLDLFNGGAV